MGMTMTDVELLFFLEGFNRIKGASFKMIVKHIKEEAQIQNEKKGISILSASESTLRKRIAALKKKGYIQDGVRVNMTKTFCITTEGEAITIEYER
ncbi:hypothetical protein IZY60_06585 [Lutibacter sp. B2]|nr:hypothetical protein [Lutibacter sp. B2]